MNPSFLGNWTRDERGQSVVELAVLLPILAFLLFAIFTVGFWMNAQQIVTLSAAQGARQGALTNDNGQIQGAIAANMKAIDSDVGDPLKSKTGVKIDPSAQNDPGRARGLPLSVTVTYAMPFFFEVTSSTFFLPFSQKFKTVRATAVSQMQCDPSPPDVVCPP